MFIQRTLLKTISATGDDSLNACRFQMLHDRICIVSLVGSQTGGFQLAQQRQSFGTVSSLSARQMKAGEHTQAVDQSVNLGAQSAARAPDRLFAFFFAAPAACWWARTIVLSMKTSSRSASPASSVSTVAIFAPETIWQSVGTRYSTLRNRAANRAMGYRCARSIARPRQTVDCLLRSDPGRYPCLAASGRSVRIGHR
jgi:hypothetical protein